MIFNKVDLTKKFIKYSECKPGQILVSGYYLESKENKFGKSTHFFKDLNGTTVGLNSTGYLDWYLESEFGWDTATPIQIVFAGKKLLEKGKFAGKESNHFEFAIGDVTEGKKLVANPPKDPDESNLGLDLE